MSHCPPTPGRVAGIDYGTVRIGIAISDPERTIASPLENYTRRGPEQDAQRFRRLGGRGAAWRCSSSGCRSTWTGGRARNRARPGSSASGSREMTGVPVEFFDERFTSREAEQSAAAADMTRKRRKKRMDMLAAQIMLTAYLESASGGQDSPGPIDD